MLLGQMMTFLSVSDTALCGRTCHTWLQVAYQRTPKKSPGATFVLSFDGCECESDHTCLGNYDRIEYFKRSPYKRHYNKISLDSRYPVLESLCVTMNELTECTIHWPESDEGHNQIELTWSLLPLLQYHSHSLTHLRFIGLRLTPERLKVIRQLPALVTLEVLLVDWNRSAPQPRPLKPYWWPVDMLRELCLPENRLTHLRHFPFEADFVPLSSDHFDCFKTLPCEVFTSLTPAYGLTKSFLKELKYFKYVRELSLHIPRFYDAFDLICDALRYLSLLETCTLGGPRYFERGELARLLQNQSRLTSLTFNMVSFESPDCLLECPRRLDALSFDECGQVVYEHLVALSALPRLERLTHCGHEFAHIALTQLEQQQLTPPSTILPRLKVFHSNWKEPDGDSDDSEDD